jgi:hypothetical protein
MKKIKISVKFASHPVTGAGRYRVTGIGRTMHVATDYSLGPEANRLRAVAKALAHWELSPDACIFVNK